MRLQCFSATYFFLFLFGGGIVLPAGAGPDEKPKEQATRTIPDGYEIIDSLLPPGTDRKDLDKQLEAALGKEAAKQVLRWESFVWRFDWDPKKVKPGEKIRVYFPDVGPLSGEDIRVKVNGKTVCTARDGKLSKEIKLPEPENENKEPLLRIHVGSRTAVVWEGVTNIYILRPVKPPAFQEEDAGPWQAAEIVTFTDFDDLEVKLDGKAHKAFLVGLRPLREAVKCKDQQDRLRKEIVAKLRKNALSARVITKRKEVLGLSLDTFVHHKNDFGHRWDPNAYPYCWSGWFAYNFNTYFLYAKATTFQDSFGNNMRYRELFEQAVKKLKDK